jgi:hypothetical protein
LLDYIIFYRLEDEPVTDDNRRDSFLPEFSPEHLELIEKGRQDTVTMAHVYLTVYTTAGFRLLFFFLEVALHHTPVYVMQCNAM